MKALHRWANWSLQPPRPLRRAAELCALLVGIVAVLVAGGSASLALGVGVGISFIAEIGVAVVWARRNESAQRTS
jgi:hypothetical protein